MARLMRAGEKYQKNFPAKKNGGWRNAKKLAQEWVEEKKAELPPAREGLYGKMTSKNSSGVVGVAIRSLSVTKPSGIKYEYWTWIALWPGCKFKGGVRFNIGENRPDEDAFTLAVISRTYQMDDREEVVAYFEKIKGKKEHKDILSKKLQYLDWE